MKREGRYFWRGIKHSIPLCCIMFFENEWDSIRKDNGEYSLTMSKMTNNEGVVLCPKCIIRKLC